MSIEHAATRWWVWLVGLLLISLLVDHGGAQAQGEVLTATPDPTGAITVEVQPNDSLWSIAAQAGIPLAELLTLNGLTEDAIIRPGQRLIVGYGTPPPTATVELPPTATLPPPTPRPTVLPPRTAICLSAYDDLNRNGMFDPGEPLRAAVAFTLFDETAVVANYVTDGVNEPHCIEDIRGGAYHITRSVAPDEVLTNDGDWALSLTTGDVARLDFGSYVRISARETAVAQPTSRPAAINPPETAVPAATRDESTSPIDRRNPTVFLALGLGVMIFVVAVLFLVIWRQIQRVTKEER